MDCLQLVGLGDPTLTIANVLDVLEDDGSMSVGVAATFTTTEYEEEVIKQFKHVKLNDNGEKVTSAPGMVVRAKVRLARELAVEAVKPPTAAAPAGFQQASEQLTRAASALERSAQPAEPKPDPPSAVSARKLKLK